LAAALHRGKPEGTWAFAVVTVAAVSAAALH
jgi:hypothetical protein